MSFLNTLYYKNLGPLMQAVNDAQAEVAAKTQDVLKQYSVWIGKQTDENRYYYTMLVSAMQSAERKLANAQKEVTREEIRHLLRREDAKAGGQPPDAPNFHYQQENNYRTLAWNQAIYAHALAASNNADVNLWPLGGRVEEALRYFGGAGFSLPARLWIFLINEHRGGLYSIFSVQPGDVLSAKDWIAKIPEVQ